MQYYIDMDISKKHCKTLVFVKDYLTLSKIKFDMSKITLDEIKLSQEPLTRTTKIL